jgi:broad specificity phosphatase PhoE
MQPTQHAGSSPAPEAPHPDTCIAFLVRHGATDNNVAHPPVLQGSRTDIDLSHTGRHEAARVGSLLSRYPLAAVYSSPLRRAVQTAEQIALPHSLLVQRVELLREADIGRWEGMSWEEVARTEPELLSRFQEDSGRFGYPEGENMEQVLRRIAPEMDQLFSRHAGQYIAIVGHNVTHRVFVCSVLGLPLAKSRQITHANCGVSVVKYRAGRAHLITLNAGFHLD